MTPESWRNWDVRRMSPAGALRYALLLSAVVSLRSLLMLAATRRKRSPRRVALNLLSPFGMVWIVWLIRQTKNPRHLSPSADTSLPQRLGARTVKTSAYAVEWTYAHEVKGALIGALIGSVIGLPRVVRENRKAEARRRAEAAEPEVDASDVEAPEVTAPTEVQEDPPRWWEVRGMSPERAVAFTTLLTAVSVTQGILSAPLTRRGLRWYRPLINLARWAPFSALLVWSARRASQEPRSRGSAPKRDTPEP